MRKIFLLFFLLFAIHAEGLKTGWLKIQLPEIPQPELQPTLLKDALNPKSEVFEIYIPKNYDASKSYGVLAWVNPHDGLQIPRHFEPLFDEYGFPSTAGDIT